MQRYDDDKLYRIINNTQSNYANQLKRLLKNSHRANFIIIYYSLALIIYSLSIKFYPRLFNTNVTSYFSIILSIIVLIYSIVNSNARYSERIESVQNGLNKMKSLKRQLGIEKDAATVRTAYEDVVNSIEIRNDIDFYYTVSHLCTKYGLNKFTGKDKKKTPLVSENQAEIEIIKAEIRGYIAEINPLAQETYINVLRIWHIGLYIAPIVIFVFCIYSNTPKLLFLK